MRICAVPGCGRNGAGHSSHCEQHKRALRRHGHPEQEGVTAHELAPYVKRVRARMKKNSSSPAWQLLRDRWAAAAAEASENERQYQAGRPYARHERAALHEVTKLAQQAEPEAVMSTALALFMMQEEQPSRFRSDRAFLFQLARRVRGLAEVNARSYWNHREGRVKRVYRDAPSKVLESVGQITAEVFGVAGLHVARLEQKEANEKAQQRAALHEALEALE